MEARISSNKSTSRFSNAQLSLPNVEFDSVDLRASSSMPGSACPAAFNGLFTKANSSGSRTPDGKKHIGDDNKHKAD